MAFGDEPTNQTQPQRNYSNIDNKQRVAVVVIVRLNWSRKTLSFVLFTWNVLQNRISVCCRLLYLSLSLFFYSTQSVHSVQVARIIGVVTTFVYDSGGPHSKVSPPLDGSVWLSVRLADGHCAVEDLAATTEEEKEDNATTRIEQLVKVYK